MSKFRYPRRGKRVLNGPISLKVAKNEPLAQIISRMLQHASETNRPVRAAFNGLVLNATKESTEKELQDMYFVQLEGRVV